MSLTNLAALSAVIKGEFDRCLVVDGVSSIASIPCPVDQWGIDVAISGSQKGWMCPPGLTMVSVSPRAWESIARAKMPRFYFDLAVARGSLQKGETPWTPALSVMYGLNAGVNMLLTEGMENVHQRHARVGEATRRGAVALGLEPFADQSHASNTVTAIKVPAGVEWKRLSEMLRQEHEVVFAGGQASLSGKIFRIGHMGWVSDADIEDALSALEQALAKLRKSRPVPARGS